VVLTEQRSFLSALFQNNLFKQDLDLYEKLVNYYCKYLRCLILYFPPHQAVLVFNQGKYCCTGALTHSINCFCIRFLHGMTVHVHAINVGRKQVKQPRPRDDSSDDDVDDDVDGDMADFIDDGSDTECTDYSHYIRELFGYDRRKLVMFL